MRLRKVMMRMIATWTMQVFHSVMDEGTRKSEKKPQELGLNVL
jgi:hypothetical protein